MAFEIANVSEEDIFDLKPSSFERVDTIQNITIDTEEPIRD